MTAEQIAALRRIPASGPFTSAEPAIMAAALTRILDEQETLVKVLRTLAGNDDGICRCVYCDRWPHADDCDLANAIKKAEAP